MAAPQTPESGFGDDPARPRLTPTEIQQKEFAVSKFGGYKMRDVDEFLDELTATVGDLLAENERVRRHAGAAPVVGSPDLDDVSRQADEIIQRARDEAATIVAQANERAASAAGVAAMASIGDEQLAAVNAFLTQERDFLQSLAGLVQGHAESVKGMAKEARRAAKAATPGSAPEAGAARAVNAEASTAEAAPRKPTRDAPVASDDTVRVDEPAPAAAAKPEAEGDSALRELFWGEE